MDTVADWRDAETSPAFYQLSSGSTGVPKCIPETHAAIIAHIRHSAQDNGHSASQVTLNWLPFDQCVAEPQAMVTSQRVRCSVRHSR